MYNSLGDSSLNLTKVSDIRFWSTFKKSLVGGWFRNGPSYFWSKMLIGYVRPYYIPEVILTDILNIKPMFILINNQLDAQNLFYNKFISCLYMFRALCAHRQVVKIVLYSLWYHHTETSEWSKITKITKITKIYKYEHIFIYFSNLSNFSNFSNVSVIVQTSVVFSIFTLR